LVVGDIFVNTAEPNEIQEIAPNENEHENEQVSTAPISMTRE